jgi:GTP cyclohydrolase II
MRKPFNPAADVVYLGCWRKITGKEMPKTDTITKAHLAAGRAVDQLRRQLGIVLQEDNGALLGACPVEGLSEGLLSQLHALPDKRLYLLLTGARARSLGLKAADAKTVRLDAENLSLPLLQALADPLLVVPNEVRDLSLGSLAYAQDESYEMLLRLAKYASLLPAMLIVESKQLPEDWVTVKLSDVAAYWAAPLFDIVPLAEARMPVAGAEQAVVTCFRERYGSSVHLALAAADGAKNQTPLVRIHSSCVTGDILGSLRCDCGDQLHLALEQIGKAGGILLYLHQEGRGIGIANKLRAYKLQEQGFDTYEANLMLGFEEDERDFSIAAAILKKLGVKAIKMLTNNPRKMAALEKAGIKVAERVPLIAQPGKHNHGYLEAKVKKAGHLL